MPFPQLARGSSLINSTRFVVQAIGVAALSTVLAASLSPQVRAFGAASQEQGASSAVAQRFGLCETPGITADKNVPPALATAPAAAQQQALSGVQAACGEYIRGFEQTYQLTFYFAVLAVLIGLFLPGWPQPWAGRASMRPARTGANPVPAARRRASPTSTGIS